MTDNEITDRFKSFDISNSELEQCNEIQEAAAYLGLVINRNCPDSRHAALAMTKLEESVMWAMKSISHNSSVISL